ncbi:ran-binding protein M homolog [Pistacia vera]|nr:ran-binding protein M homolog [Pistacia vera]
MRTLEILSKKLKFFEVDLMVRTSKALKDVQPELEKLRQKAVSKVFDFIVQKLYALRKPKTNIQILQQNVLLKYKVHVDFGQKKFAFDLKEYEAQERMKQQTTIEKISLPPNISYELVCSYLLHYGYEDTLHSFDLASKSAVPPVFIAQENGVDEQDITYALNQRKTLGQLIRSGDIDTAFCKLHNWYPWIVQVDFLKFRVFAVNEYAAVCISITFVYDIEEDVYSIEEEVGAVEEAVKYGRTELAKIFGLAGFADLVQDCVALLAYEKPQELSVGYLLEDSQREVIFFFFLNLIAQFRSFLSGSDFHFSNDFLTLSFCNGLSPILCLLVTLIF